MNIANRMAAWEGSGVYSTKDYVQSGLILHLDGIENAGYGVHDSTATTWTDLSGVTGAYTLNSGAAFGSNCATGSASTSIAYRNERLTNCGTCEIVCSIQQTGYEIMFMKRGRYGVMYVNPDGTITAVRSGGGSGGLPTWAPSGKTGIDIDTPMHIAYQGWSDSAMIVYGNGVIMDKVSETGSSAYSGMDDTQRLMINTGGALYAVRYYSRVLTASEIAANYAIDKARFNLT